MLGFFKLVGGPDFLTPPSRPITLYSVVENQSDVVLFGIRGGSVRKKEGIDEKQFPK